MYANIISPHVTGGEGPIMVKDYHFSAQRSYSPATMDSISAPLVMVHQSTHYTKYIHYNIPSDWVVHNSLSGYMDRIGWHKSMAHCPSMCFSSPFNHQMIFYDGHDSHFYDSVLNILRSHNNQSFILKAGYSVHDQPN